MSIPSENHPWRKYTSLSKENPSSLNADILELTEMLRENGFSVSHSYMERHVRLGNIPGFYKVKVSHRYKWYIRLEDAKEFVKSFNYFGRNK